MDGAGLDDLRAFAAVARLRNFRRAALELRISVSGLSQRMRELEERLGVRLLNRTTRSVSPTEAGERLLRRLAPALTEVAAALDEVRDGRDRPAGRLRINAPAPAVDLVLAPMVAPFLARCPEVDLEIAVDTALIDIVAQGYDAGVRYEEHLAQDMVAVPLGPPQRYVLAASPALLARHGTPTRPEDLPGLPGITTVFPSGMRLDWEFEKEGRTVRIRPEGPFRASSIGVQIRAAIDGAGFLMSFDGYLRDAIADGRLVPVLEEWSQPFPGPFLYYPSARQPPPALRAFVDFVRGWRRRPDPAAGPRSP